MIVRWGIQRSDGALPCIVPTGGWGFALYNGASWDFAVAEVPWTVYEHRGDRRILELAYPAVVKYVKYQVKRCPERSEEMTFILEKSTHLRGTPFSSQTPLTTAVTEGSPS